MTGANLKSQAEFHCPQCRRKFQTTRALDQHCRDTQHKREIHRNTILPHSNTEGNKVSRIAEFNTSNNSVQRQKKSLEKKKQCTQKIQKHKTIIMQLPTCPPHEFLLADYAMVGFGPGNGGQTRQDEPIERCIHCGHTRLQIEKSEKYRNKKT